MRLILAKRSDEKLQPSLDHLKVQNALFVLQADDKKSFNVLKPEKKLYFYLDDDGGFSEACGLFKEEPVFSYRADFWEAAQTPFRLFTFQLEKNEIKGDERFFNAQSESLKLRGSRLSPTFLEITSVKTAQMLEDDTQVAIVKGNLYRAVDPRTPYLMPDVSTLFGKGTFKPENTRALTMGLYFYPHVSPFSEAIKAKATEQKVLYEKLFDAVNNEAPIERITRLRKAIDASKHALRPHAGEVYDITPEEVVYFIGADGQWRAEHLPGMRPIDSDDKRRLLKLMDKYRKSPDLARRHAESFGVQRFADRLEVSDEMHAIPITSVLAPSLLNETKAVESNFLDRQTAMSKLTPSKAPLGPGDIPGLKEGVELFPHQALTLASLEGRERMLVDADPGAGKTLIIICDILRGMKTGRVKRPLIVMPESLIGQFANEVKQFSELNPWLISTKAVANWKDGDLETFLSDASKAPPNTVFLTSYNWLAREHLELPNGDVTKNEDRYKTFKIFLRPDRLIKELGLDSVWMDECHSLKNTSNQSWAATTFAKLPILRGLTGTIMPGNPADILGPMSVIHSGIFGLKDEFLKRFTLNGTPYAYQDDAPKQIRDVLRGFGMRSLRKSAWASLLPKVHRKYHYVKLTANQQKAYDALLQNILSTIKNDPKLANLLAKFESQLDQGEEVGVGNLLARFVPLDIFLNAPASSQDWIKAVLKDPNDSVSPKAAKIAEIAEAHLKEPNSGKVLILLQFKDGAKSIFDALPESLKDVAAYYEGGRIDELARFKDPKDEGVKILVAVDKTIRTGHNIQSCNCIIHADHTWMQGDMAQREGRAVRIGQKRDVYVHQVIAEGTAEVLKIARLASSEHMVAKANSDFEDDVVLQPVTMSLHAMSDFRSKDQLKPYIERRQKIEAHVEKQAVKDAEFFGTKLLKPRSYESIDTVFKDARMLAVLPSSGSFQGSLRDRDQLVEKELADLPTEARLPGQTLAFHLKHWNDAWHLVCFKSVDTQGFLRKFGFNLVRSYLYRQVRNKSEAINLVQKLQKDLDIINIEDLEDAIGSIRVTAPGVPQGTTKMSKQDKKSVSGQTVLAAVKGAVSMEFATLDGAPVLFVDTLNESDDEVRILKSHGFTVEPASWQRELTRGQLVNLLKKLRSQHTRLRIKDWNEFKEKAKISFRGLDLSEFDAFNN